MVCYRSQVVPTITIASVRIRRPRFTRWPWDAVSIEPIRPVRSLRPGVSRPFAKLAGVAGRGKGSRLGAKRPGAVLPERQPHDGGRRLGEARVYGGATEKV